MVMVPVVIVANKVTTVHLEGGWSADEQKPDQGNAVRLPDEMVVGPRAIAADSSAR